MKSTITYLKNFLKDKDVASVTPSSKLLIRRVCGPIDFDKDIVILEYGAGTGVFADYLLKQMTKDSKLILFETNEDFYDKLKEISDPRVEVFNDSVEHVKTLLKGKYLDEVDYVISGIPFSFLEPDMKSSILSQTVDMLKKGGKFLAYQTSGHLKDPLRKAFGNISTEMEFLNVPPMVVYEATKE
ncbi:methyltransferase [Aliifodinibius sp. S!AR15-10]|uniref:class I SAM-dependent methyltransferase n=1 Tax=Aliifodinibius sp. S!AR15-10 TaxID=2950437 RepID=UPI00285D2F38|nr:methyltransferase domain-containing protein [Aliifodinibius sp. S!AR15-10]MDR8393144.1 methyltransferase [Aliifodinibius sp. S!AR15-10]